MKKGQALIFVFFVILLIGTLASALSVMWQGEIQTRAAEKNGLNAFYLAQAGLEQAKLVAVKTALTGWQPCADDNNPTCWYNSFSTGRYKFNITNMGGALRFLESKGEVVDSANVALAHRELEVEVDISGPSQQSGTWSEQ